MASSSGLGHSSAKSAWVFQTQARSLPAFGFSSIIGVTGGEEPHQDGADHRDCEARNLPPPQKVLAAKPRSHFGQNQA